MSFSRAWPVTGHAMTSPGSWIRTTGPSSRSPAASPWWSLPCGSRVTTGISAEEEAAARKVLSLLQRSVVRLHPARQLGQREPLRLLAVVGRLGDGGQQPVEPLGDARTQLGVGVVRFGDLGPVLDEAVPVRFTAARFGPYTLRLCPPLRRVRHGVTVLSAQGLHGREDEQGDRAVRHRCPDVYAGQRHRARGEGEQGRLEHGR
ncbi:hypothetical protein [Streptomyces sp. NPDC050428]